MNTIGDVKPHHPGIKFCHNDTGLTEAAAVRVELLITGPSKDDDEYLTLGFIATCAIINTKNGKIVFVVYINN